MSHDGGDASPITVTGNSTVRTRAYRRRRWHGLRRLSILVPRSQLDNLEQQRYLDPDLRGQRADECEAIERFTRQPRGHLRHQISDRRPSVRLAPGRITTIAYHGCELR